jgi:transcription elongation factor SPT5
LDPAFHGKKVLMEITGTLGAWRDGELNGAKGFVTNVFRTPGDTLICIEHVDPDRAGTTVDVPISYLSPVRPERERDHAVPLEGPARGTEVILSQEDAPGIWQVSRSLDSEVFTCLGSDMVKVHVK